MTLKNKKNSILILFIRD